MTSAAVVAGLRGEVLDAMAVALTLVGYRLGAIVVLRELAAAIKEMYATNGNLTPAQALLRELGVILGLRLVSPTEALAP